MESKRICAIVQDLLPAYIDKLTKQETTAFVDQHLTDCEQCRKVCRAMSGALPEEAVQAEGIVQRLKAARDRKLAICWAAAAAVLLLLAVCLLPLPRRFSATHEGLLWRCGTPEETQSTTVTVNGIYDDYLFRTDTFTGSVWVEDCPETHGALSITKLGENQYGIWYETPQSRLNAFGSLFIRKDGSLMVIIDEDGHWDGATGRMLTAPASTREEAVALANELAAELSPSWLGRWQFD